MLVSRAYISVRVRCMKLIMGSTLGEVNLEFFTNEMYICCWGKRTMYLLSEQNQCFTDLPHPGVPNHLQSVPLKNRHLKKI